MSTCGGRNGGGTRKHTKVALHVQNENVGRLAMMAVRQADEPTLPLPGLYDLAKPKLKSTSLGYHWKIGGDLPILGNHSVAKHKIFDRYIDTYVSTLTQNHIQTKLNLTIVDGFCGGGRYQLGGDEVDGSPMRMLHAIEQSQAKLTEVRARGFEVNASFIFIDENANHIEFLRDLLIQRGYSLAANGLWAAGSRSPIS
jgi:hypothetical protein